MLLEGNEAWQALRDDEEESADPKIRWRQHHRANKLCVECSRVVEPNRTRCQYHLTMAIARNKNMRQRRKIDHGE